MGFKELILDAFTLAMLVLPTDALPQEYDSPEMRLSMGRVLEAAHLCQWRYMRTMDYTAGVRWYRRWLQNNPTTPDLTWTNNLPPTAVIDEGFAMNTGMYNGLDERRDLTFDQRLDARCALNRVRLVYLAMWNARNATYWSTRREALQGLRKMVGDAAFVRGDWPCPVPLEFVPDVGK